MLLCIDSLRLGGKERQAVALVKGLAGTSGISVRVVCLEAEEFYLPDLQATGISVEFVTRSVRWDPRPLFRLEQLVGTFQPDVIHTNGLISSVYCWPIASRRSVPLINGSIRNAFADGDWRWTCERLLLKVSDYRVANSLAGLSSRGFSNEDPRNVVIYNGFDFARVDQRTLHQPCREPSHGEHSYVAGMVAEFSPYKDYQTFIDTARILEGRRPYIRFLAVGNGETLAAAQAAASGLSNIQFLGARKDVEQIISCFDVGVLCTFTEGLSNSIMEYMALGKPVVATNSGGTGELVVDGATGILVKQSDPHAVAAAIEHLVANPPIAEAMGREGQRRLRSDFTLQRMIDDTVSLSHEAAARSGRATATGLRRSISTHLTQ